MKYIILLASFFVLIYAGITNYIMFQEVNNQVEFMKCNLLFDISLLCLFIFILNKRKKFLFPSAFFAYVYFIYDILGKFVWIYREGNWFNEEGDPKNVALQFSFFAITLFIISISSLKLNTKRINGFNLTKYNHIFIPFKYLLYCTILCFIGTYLFTNGFKIIPIFSKSMDESRVQLIDEGSNGRGIGFVLLLFGVLANSLALLSLDKIKVRSNKYLYIVFITINTIFLALYSGRFLPIIPFVLYFFTKNQGKKIKYSRFFKVVIIGLSLFSLLMYFGAIRQFGSNVDFDLAIRYLIADAFPEFRMTVYLNTLNQSNLFANFFYTIISGLLPGFIFKIIGVDKADLYKPIGGKILDLTHFDSNSTPGIRASLFGELLTTGAFVYVFMLLMALILIRLDTSFFKIKIKNLKFYKVLSVSIFLSFSIPYGSLFLISVIEWGLLLLIIDKYLNDKGRRIHFNAD